MSWKTAARAALVLLILAPAIADAKAYYSPRDELIEIAEHIAVVEVKAVRAVQAQGPHWTYRQAADVEVRETLKGSLPKSFVLHAEKTFICARASYTPGRYLVFLQQQGDLLVTQNHHLGQFRIDDQDRVQYFKTGDRIDRAQQPLASVLKHLRSTLGEEGKAARLAPATALFPRQVKDPERTYERDSVVELDFPGRSRLLRGVRLFKATYFFEVPRVPGSNVHGRYAAERFFVRGARDGKLKPVAGADLQSTVLGLFTSATIVQRSQQDRLAIGAAMIWLLDGGGHALGEWWGKGREVDSPTADGGRSLQVFWTHGKSFSWTDVFTLRFSAKGHLSAIEHEKRNH